MEILKKLKFSRRHALRGMVGGIGVSLSLPVLEIMCNNSGTAFAQGAPLPTTFGIFFWGNGIHPGSLWTPSGTGDGNAWQLPPNLQDFANLKDHMTLVTGLDMMDAQFKGHGWGVVYVLAGGDGTICNTTADISKSQYGGLPETSRGTQWQPTIDQLIAKAIHADEPYKSLETGILKYVGVNMGTASLNLAHIGPNMPLPPERDPAKLFNTLFGMGTPMGLPIEISNQLRRSVLDAVLSDAKRLQMSVGSADSKRIDAHMESVRALEMRIPTGGVVPPPMPACQAPTLPTEKAANVDLAKVTATSKAINKLIAVALSCNLTRVYSHLWSGARDDTHYPIIQLDSEHHSLTHDVNQTGYDNSAKIEKYIMSQYADLAQTLKDTPMGAGNLLDNTIIYGISDVAEPRGHVMKNYHIVLMGHAGGKIKGNRHYRKTGRKVTELMLTLQKVMGMNVSSFGSWDKTSTTMQEILT
jgi:hypothetical protein